MPLILFLFQVSFLFNFFIFSCPPMVFHLISHSAFTKSSSFYPVIFAVRRHIVSSFLHIVSLVIAPFLPFHLYFLFIVQ